jgi:hypothetical protein
MQNFKRLMGLGLIAAALLAVTAPFKARANVQPHDILNGGTNVVVSATTNTYSGTGLIFDCSKSTDITFEFSFTCTNANKMKVGDGCTVTLDGAINPTHTDLWASNAISVTVPNNGSGVIAVGLTNLPAGLRYPFWRVGQVWNTNVSGTNLSSLKVRCHTKNGM